MKYEWDENKRQSNLEKHGLDFNDAHLVYESPCKLTLPGKTKAEPRLHDLAEIEDAVVVLSCIYTLRGKTVRIISFRQASATERKLYYEKNS